MHAVYAYRSDGKEGLGKANPVCRPKIKKLPYKGTGAALPDVVAGQVQMMVDGPLEAFARYTEAELKRWGEVVRAANIKIE